MDAVKTWAWVAGVVFAGVAIAATVPAALYADWIITRQGERFEILGTWHLKGKLAIFTLPNSTLSSIRADQVDFEASKQATEQAKNEAAAPTPAPDDAKPQGKAVISLTDKDFKQKTPPPIASSATGKRGMTWQLDWTNPTAGTIDVGCGNGNHPPCDAYNGDTACTERLPILCIKKQGAGFPLPLPAGVDNTDIYHQWSGGIVGITEATVPPTDRAAANALCAEKFGEGWRVAEFHDGWGWHFQASGSVGDSHGRFWVDINDQPSTCWK